MGFLISPLINNPEHLLGDLYTFIMSPAGQNLSEN